MTTAHHDSERLSEARANHAHNEKVQQARAMRTVDDHATDAQDRAMLIAMLGLVDGAAQAARAPHLGPLT